MKFRFGLKFLFLVLLLFAAYSSGWRSALIVRDHNGPSLKEAAEIADRIDVILLGKIPPRPVPTLKSGR